MKGILFHNLIEDQSLSMKRYSKELSDALRGIGEERWEFEDVVDHQPRVVSQLVPEPHRTRFNSAIGRYLYYPFRILNKTGDVYHILDHGYAQLVLGLDRRRTVVTCHDLIPLLAHAGVIPMRISKNVALTFKFRLACMVKASYVIAVSEATKRTLLTFSKIPPERIIVVPYGVSEAFTPPCSPEPARTLRLQFGIPEGSRVVLHVGTRGQYKNTPAILFALHILKTLGFQNIWLLRVGADFYAEEKTLIHKLGLGRQIVYAGQVSNDERLAQFYHAADSLVFPSMWEGFGWPPLEAMACGTSVVTSDAASLPEVVGKAGLMVNPQDYGGLARAIREVLMNDELRKSMVVRGLGRAQQFTWEETARKTLAVYEKVIAQTQEAL